MYGTSPSSVNIWYQPLLSEEFGGSVERRSCAIDCLNGAQSLRKQRKKEERKKSQRHGFRDPAPNLGLQMSEFMPCIRRHKSACGDCSNPVCQFGRIQGKCGSEVFPRTRTRMRPERFAACARFPQA